MKVGLPTEDPTENLTWYNEEMEECANGYAAYVLELLTEAKKVTADPIVLIEQRLDYSKYVESGFGTGDCLLIADGTLNIVDYKHGNGNSCHHQCFHKEAGDGNGKTKGRSLCACFHGQR